MCHQNPVLNIEILLCTEIFLLGSCISANGSVQREYVTVDRISEPWSYMPKLHMQCKGGVKIFQKTVWISSQVEEIAVKGWHIEGY